MKSMRHASRTLCCMFLLMLCLSPALSFAAESPKTAAPVQAKTDDPPASAPGPAATAAARKTPVAVDQTGTDTLGAKLAYQVKETFNSGSLFTLSAKDEPKLSVLIFTQTEFPSRPGVGSMYSVIWVYSESAKVFSTYLDQTQGIVTPDTVNDVAAVIAQRTDGIVAKYSYIFK